jgi:hypothetical protein
MYRTHAHHLFTCEHLTDARHHRSHPHQAGLLYQVQSMHSPAAGKQAGRSKSPLSIGSTQLSLC